jgi:tRNA uridine 5-carboxymethylaminomethyl modification enzyme
LAGHEAPGGGVAGVSASGFGACATALPPELRDMAPAERDEVLYRVAYAGYLEREKRQIARLADVEKIKIPADFDYLAVKGLRAESRAKLLATRPVSLGQASRISGVNPADISVLMVLLGSRGRAGVSDERPAIG